MKQRRVKDVLYQDEDENSKNMELNPRLEKKLFRSIKGKRRRW